jgi:hypothetical protein
MGNKKAPHSSDPGPPVVEDCLLTSRRMSALAQLEPLLESLVAASFVGSAENEPRYFAALRRVFVYQCDKTIRNYRAAKLALDEGALTADTYLAGCLAFHDHMENAISSLRRCYRLFDRLKGGRLDRTTRQLFERGLPDFKDLRDFAEHIDDHIVEGRADGLSLFVRVLPSELGMLIGPHSIAFVRIEQLIARAHEAARAFLRVD